MENIRNSRRGSSPLARGTPRGFVERSGLVGLIPARAGNTISGSANPSGKGAHPRSRGEHFSFLFCAENRAGSSPLARGTLSSARALAGGSGLIPARAGNTGWVREDGQLYGAHPRSRGEHPPVTVSVGSWVGSSPLARGTPQEPRPTRQGWGLIPARAGNTLCVRSNMS